MTPTLILFAIKSFAQLAQATNRAFEQSARDEPALFPTIRASNLSTRDEVSNFFNLQENKEWVSRPDGPLAEHWDGDRPKFDTAAVEVLFARMLEIETERGGGSRHYQAKAGILLVEQWNKDDANRPPPPWTRVLLTAGNVALEYVSINPDILGLDGKGERIVAAYAENLSELLPDDGDFGPRDRFAERLAGLFLRAGLSTLNEHPDWVVSEEHVQQLISASTKPLLDAFPANDDTLTTLKWSKVVDALMGPVSSAALKTLAEHQTAFLGTGFAPDKALGAVTRALFLEAVDRDLDKQLTKEGLIALFKSAASLAADNPGLFVNDGEEPEDELIRDLLQRAMKVFVDAPEPLAKSIGISLAAAALKAVGANAHRFADEENPWQQAAADGASLVISELGGAVTANKDLGNVISTPLLVELGRILLTRIAASPQLVTGGTDTWNGVIKAVSTAMVADKELLLSGDDWRELVVVIADTAAKDPGRLFRLDPEDQDSVLAGKLLALVLDAAGDAFADRLSGSTSVLVGATLLQALVTLLQSTAGAAATVKEQLDEIEALLAALNHFFAENAMRYGGAAWLRLFSILLVRLLRSEPVPSLDVATVDLLLKESAS